jgi:hypothetical protein
MSSPPVFNPDIMPVFDNVEFRNESKQKAGMFVSGEASNLLSDG